jgi:8-oxo-dGTP pyrophosphatase MutT (NUDIX family)
MAHIHEKIDYAADVLVVHNRRVLLRMHDKYKMWLAVGGHIELDEDPLEAAVREVKEEVGLDVTIFGSIDPEILAAQQNDSKEILPPRFINRHRINETHEHISLLYFATSESDDVKPEYADDKSDEWHWFTKEELIENSQGVPELMRLYALSALQTVCDL